MFWTLSMSCSSVYDMNNTTTEITGFDILGTTDSIDTCDCCGRTGLKSTVIIRFADGAEPVHYGRTCAARYAGVKVSVVDRGIRSAQAIARAAAFAEAQAHQAAETARWFAFLSEATGLDGAVDTHEAIQALGGFVAARAAYAEAGA